MSLLRGLFGERGGRRDEPAPAVVARDVGHRVFIERAPERRLAAPRRAPGREPSSASTACGCSPCRPRARRPAGVRRRVAALERPALGGPQHRRRRRARRAVVSRSADGATALALTTTVEPLDGGCVVAQRLDGLAPVDPVAEFARAWMARALLGLKADVEGNPRSRTARPGSDEPVEAGDGERLRRTRRRHGRRPRGDARARDGLDRGRRRTRPALGAARPALVGAAAQAVARAARAHRARRRAGTRARGRRPPP